jgi:hypothetical protein
MLTALRHSRATTSEVLGSVSRSLARTRFLCTRVADSASWRHEMVVDTQTIHEYMEDVWVSRLLITNSVGGMQSFILHASDLAQHWHFLVRCFTVWVV